MIAMPLMTVAQIKDAVRKRDGYACVDCGCTQELHLRVAGVKLHVHRQLPGTAYIVDGCVSLCGRCHHKRHSFRGPRKGGKPVTFRMPEALHQALQRFAIENGMKSYEVIIAAIEMYLDKHWVDWREAPMVDLDKLSE